jgi:hypothetical protein
MSYDTWKSTEPLAEPPVATYHYAVLDSNGVLRTFDTQWDAEAWMRDMTILEVCDFCGQPTHAPDCPYNDDVRF